MARAHVLVTDPVQLLQLRLLAVQLTGQQRAQLAPRQRQLPLRFGRGVERSHYNDTIALAQADRDVCHLAANLRA